MFLHLQNIWIKILDVFNITEDESLLRVKAECDDVLNVADAHLDSLLKLQIFLVQILFVIRDLDYERYVKDSLQILSKNEWNSMTQMEGLGRWASSCVEVEGFKLLVTIKT